MTFNSQHFHLMISVWPFLRARLEDSDYMDQERLVYREI